MAEPLDSLIDLLCRSGTSSDCQRFVSGFQDPASQLVFFIFFPLVFLVIFCWILGQGVSQGNAKFALLVGVAVFLFIVFQGWYHIFLNVSRFWFIAVIVLGGFYVVMNRMGPASGGGGTKTKTSAGVTSGIRGFASKKLKSAIKGDEDDLRKEIRDAFNSLEGFYNEVKNNPKGSEARGNAATNFISAQNRLRKLITSYGKYGEIEIGGVRKNITGQQKKYWDEYTKWSERFRDIEK